MSLLNQLVIYAEYNQLMNQRLYDAAAQLTVLQQNDDKGAFFGSVLGTLNHILVGDIIWLKRFATHPGSAERLADVAELKKPVSLDAVMYEDFAELRAEREKLDEVIIHWIDGLSEADLEDALAYRDTKDVPYRKNFGSLISHLFLHQIHHRGQVTTLVSQCGIDFGDTDIIEIIEDI